MTGGGELDGLASADVTCSLEALGHEPLHVKDGMDVEHLHAFTCFLVAAKQNLID